MKKLVALLPLVLLALAAPAGAVPPDRSFLPAGDLPPTTGICSFPLEATVLVNREYQTVFYDQAGNITKVMVSGTLVVQITNSDTGYSVIRNTSGPGIFTFPTEDSFTLQATGAWFFFFFPGEPVSGPPSRALISRGRVIFHVSPSGETWQLVGGTVEDLCETLAPPI